MASITVDHGHADTFSIGVRDHRLTVDQPVADGGSDAGPTPTELFVASLAGCVAHYARRYLALHDLPQKGLRVIADYDLAFRPTRVGRIRLILVVPDGQATLRKPAGTARADDPLSPSVCRQTMERHRDPN
jgi:hypothetical protein